MGSFIEASHCKVELFFSLDLRGWISKDSNLETPMNIKKNEFLCLGKGKLLGDMGFTKKKGFQINLGAVGGWC